MQTLQTQITTVCWFWPGSLAKAPDTFEIHSILKQVLNLLSMPIQVQSNRQIIRTPTTYTPSIISILLNNHVDLTGRCFLFRAHSCDRNSVFPWCLIHSWFHHPQLFHCFLLLHRLNYLSVSPTPLELGWNANYIFQGFRPTSYTTDTYTTSQMPIK